MIYWQDNLRTLYNKDCRSMSELPDESVQMVCCSPPYWGLRKYAGLPDLVWGGDENCQHEWRNEIGLRKTGGNIGGRADYHNITQRFTAANNSCSLCGAVKGAFGLESSPEEYVQHSIEILREIRRVLRPDGVVFWNIGDSYATSSPGTNQMKPVTWEENGQEKKRGMTRIGKVKGLKPKDLCLIPFRLAIRLQEDSWWVRSVIIWAKNNPMPESVRDRPSRSHEYILMLTKSARYYWDAEAVREAQSPNTHSRGASPKDKNDGVQVDGKVSHKDWMKYTNDWLYSSSGRNLRSVWTFSTQSYKKPHFATFPEALPERCIKAATPEVGCCSKCGKPWVRIVERQKSPFKDTRTPGRHTPVGNGKIRGAKLQEWLNEHPSQTLGWKPACKCSAEKIPSICLDPFAGSGTTLKVAAELNRRAVGYELSREYCDLAVERNRQEVLL